MTAGWSTAALREALEGELRRRLDPGARVVGFERRPSPYRTSFALEEVDVEPAGGGRLPLMFKDVGLDALEPAARAAKPAFLHDPLREAEVYERLLDGAALGTARLYGTVDHPSGRRHGLFLERVAGVELYQVGPRATWEHVARWLAGMHVRLHGRAAATRRLLRHDAAWLRRWPQRAAEHARAGRAELRAVSDGYDAVLARLAELPAGPVHGEFYASNVLVDDASAPDRVCPVDWEMAAVGPWLVDLAALTSGRWSEEDRQAIATAYRDALPAGARPAPDAFDAGLAACRLHLALQWLGWSPDWSPPEEHATDWLEEALRMAARIGLA